MKFVTFEVGGQPNLGVSTDGRTLVNLTQAWKKIFPCTQAPGDLAEFLASGVEVESLQQRLSELSGEEFRVMMDEIKILAPIPRPTKNIFCVGRNYREHIIEGNRAAGRDPNDFPKATEFFSKPPTTVVGHGAEVKAHAEVTNLLDYEIELGIVIGKSGSNIKEADALDYVFGFTVINDITGRDLQKLHGQWFKGKALDTTCPIGPCITHKSAISNPQDLDLELYVNGDLRQKANTSDMLFTVAQIIEQLSAGLTLEPGDIIATGTPSGVGFAMSPPCRLVAGDEVLARICGIGDLINRIVN
ncbi:fumarylacetoacetate hydrolase family protein [Pseudomonas congelans]|uniref:fumarylacetoacetate hydrolase family protein n=1 Tax=Pseudomonas congelans TaxID=200452 RepID=UPI001655C63C|nr:fumarylacetoacetate hydrolase family protein [Pseudomonas congelans]MBC8802639.1 fumarylacetoacetate hydrolase family protein [Pseudomonas congelans]